MYSCKKNVIIFKEKMLRLVERFVYDQAKHLINVHPVFVGINKIDEFDLFKENSESFFLEKSSKFESFMYKLFGYAPTLVQFLKEKNPNIIHVHMGGDATRFVRLRKHFNIPLVVTYHGVDAATSDFWKLKERSLYSKQYLLMRKKLIKETNCFIAISNYVKKRMIEQGIPERKIIVHYIGVDTDFFAPNPAVKRENIVLFVGRLVKMKGVDYLLKAMKIVQVEMPNSLLVVIGDGPEYSNLMSLSRELGVNVKFMGLRDKYFIKEYLQKAKVFCGPSISIKDKGAEGLGLVFLEAQSMGVPVVCFDSGGVTETIIDKSTGFSFKEGDIEGLSSGIINLLRMDNLSWENISCNCRNHIVSNFDIKKQTSKLEDIYQDLIYLYNK